MPPILEVRNLYVHYYTLRGIVKAVENVSFTLEPGEVLGIAGESGCGKSTLAWSLLRLVPPPGRIVKGSIIIDGQDIVNMSEDEVRARIRWQKISMVFQGAMNALNPMYKVWEQIAEPLIVHRGMTKEQAYRRAVEVLKLVGLGEDIANRYPHELSGGQKQRVVIAMALVLDPPILIADEPTTALDTIIQAQILNLLKQLKNELNMSIIFITHDLSVIAEMADKIAIMYAGQIVEYGPSEEIFNNPQHPYTRALLRAIPRLRGPKEKLHYIPGQPPDLRTPPPGCRFAPRCSEVMPICREQEPPYFQVNEGHFAKCWLHRGKPQKDSIVD
ncbi:ABC transporter ATP-binding protein [Hyperthermus butylicus]|uniref:Oligopeptide transport ATP-binding protein n=1 Tax=Hyperthermus butylicus (strain DSM 5456 / JCM 9403 / PLM1-5) TaxID=415426 RepID=A2BMZ6_HYPBU|nr:ABC transporter ATP-binding protein [Hyperthermus butylicus]ABM81357.1 Oligopeptide transport ATP-binding protein [Hyperthermus butylicus DSM 5456]